MKKVYVVSVEVRAFYSDRSATYWANNGEFIWKTMDDAVAFINVANGAEWKNDVRFTITPKTAEEIVEDGEDGDAEW